MSTTQAINGTNYTLPSSGESGWDSQLALWFAALAQAAIGFLFFGNSSVPNSGTNFLRPQYRDSAADTTEVFIPCPASGTLRALYVKATTGPTVSSGHTFTVRKNGVDTTMTCTMAFATTTAQDTSNSVSVTAGDTISIKTTGTPTAGAINVIASLRFSPS